MASIEIDADWGVKNYKGTRQDGSKWEKVIKWFGFKLHLLVDSIHELPPFETGFALPQGTALVQADKCIGGRQPGAE